MNRVMTGPRPLLRNACRAGGIPVSARVFRGARRVNDCVDFFHLAFLKWANERELSLVCFSKEQFGAALGDHADKRVAAARST